MTGAPADIQYDSNGSEKLQDTDAQKPQRKREKNVKDIRYGRTERLSGPLVEKHSGYFSLLFSFDLRNFKNEELDLNVL